MMMKYLIGVFIILAVGLFIVIYLQSPLSYRLREYDIQPKPLIRSEMYFSDELVLNKPTILTLYLTSSKNESNLTAEIILPAELELVGGNLSWTGDLSTNQTVDIQATVKPVKEGNFTANVVISRANKLISENSTKTTVTESKVEEVKTVKIPPSPSWITDKANNYMISLLGESYFYNNIRFVVSLFQGPEQYTVEYRHPKIDFIQVRLDQYGNITSYRGPTKPYSFNVTKEQAIEIAKSYGLMEPIEASIVYGGIGYQIDSGSIYESYMWHVSRSGGSLPAGNLEIVYLDVDNGNVLGKLTYRNVKVVLPVERFSEFHVTPLPKKVLLGEPINTSFKFSPWVNVSNLTATLNFTEAFEIVNVTGNISDTSSNVILWYGALQAFETIEINVTLKAIKTGNWTVKISAIDYGWEASPQYSTPIDSAYVERLEVV